MLTCAPRVPSMKSRLANSGSPSRPSPTGSLRSIRSKNSAWSRCAPDARCTSGTGPGRHVHLGLDPRRGDLRRLDRLGREHAVGDEEDVGVEAGALVPGADLGDDARQPHRFRLAARHRALADDDVVELQVLVLGERDPERRAGSRPRCRAPDRLVPFSGTRPAGGFVMRCDGTPGVGQQRGTTAGPWPRPGLYIPSM